MRCHGCQSEIKFEGRVARTEECPNCGADVHCCLNCEMYDETAHNRCIEPQAEWVSDREKANFCDYFTPNSLGAGKTVGADARRAFDDLFK